MNRTKVLNLQERLIRLLAKSKSPNAQTRRRAIAEINTTPGMSSYLAQVMRCRLGEPPMPLDTRLARKAHAAGPDATS